MIPDSDIPFIFLHLLDNCKKLGLVFENVVGIVEIINSKAVQLQVRWSDFRLCCLAVVGSVALTHTFLNVFLKVLGKVPTISINKTEGCQVYLSKESLHCDIVSAKSSEMNILIPQDDDEFVSVGDSPAFCLRCATLIFINSYL